MMKIINKNNPPAGGEKNGESSELGEDIISEKQEVLPTPEKLAEKREFLEDKGERERIRAQIEAMDLDDSLKMQVPSHAVAAQSSNTQETIKNLLSLAKSKGVIFAVHVAKKIDDPYILDTFHDALAKEGYYKEFLK